LLDELHQAGSTAETRLKMVEERDRILQDQQQALGTLNDELVRHREAMENAHGALAKESRLRSELQSQLQMMDRSNRSMNHDLFWLKNDLKHTKKDLRAVVNSRGWRVYMALTKPLRLMRRFAPELKKLRKEPSLIGDWSREAVRLWKLG
ncbi:MAG: hypothetical protein AB2690_00195, partial [Candidatus Thiodiazotropha endolucinida]